MNNVYESASTLEAIMEAMEPYLPNLLPDNVKKKRSDVINDVCHFKGTKEKPEPDLWDRQHAVTAAIKPILISHLLGENEIIIPIIVEEYRVLAQALKDLEAEVKKRLNQFNELKEPASKLTCYPQKMISGFLFDDLSQLASNGVEFDMKEAMTKYKEKRND